MVRTTVVFLLQKSGNILSVAVKVYEYGVFLDIRLKSDRIEI
jgi:hypothetical protein